MDELANKARNEDNSLHFDDLPGILALALYDRIEPDLSVENLVVIFYGTRFVQTTTLALAISLVVFLTSSFQDRRKSSLTQ